MAVFPQLNQLVLYDIDIDRAELFRDKIQQQFEQIEEVTIVKDIPAMLSQTELVSLATTVGTAYLADISQLQPGSTILNVSLRDITPQQVGNRNFIRCSLGSILSGKQPVRKASTDISIFSPFGLGILDIALAQSVSKFAKETGKGMNVPSFLPESWINSNS